MSENLGTIRYEVEVETSRVVTGTTAAEKQLDKLDDKLGQVENTSKGLTSNLSKLSGAIGAVIAAGALREMAEMVQKYQEMADRVRLATSSQQEYNEVQERLLKTANGTYRSLQETQEVYIRTADSLRSMGYSTQAALDVTDSMSYAFVKNATSADRAGNAIDALSKSVNTGKVAADQWETITSAIPSVINDIADASGKTAAEVRALGAAGKLTANDLTEGLRKSLEANAEAAAGMSNNLVDASVRTKTAITAVLVEMENQTGALQSLTNGIIQAADAMLSFGGDSEKVAVFLNAITVAATATGAVIAGRLVGSMYAYAAAQAAVLKGMYTQITTAGAVTGANLMLAQSENAAAQAALAQAAAAAKASVGLQTHAVLANELAIAEARAALATEKLNSAMSASAAVATRTSIAMGAMKSVMALLGGPAGVIFLAVAALAAFASQATSTKVDVDALNGSLKTMGFYQLQKSANDTRDDIQKLNKELAAARNNRNTRTQSLFDSDDDFKKKQQGDLAELERVNAEIKKREDLLKAIQAQQDSMANTPAPTGAPGEAPAQQDSAEAAKVIKNLQDQADLLKVLGVERAKLAAIQKLGDDASPAQRIEAEKLAASIYELEQAQSKQKDSEKKGISEAAAAAKKASEDQKKGNEDNLKVFQELQLAISGVNMPAKELAMRQAELSLNEYATDEQIAKVREMAGALYDMQQQKNAKDSFGKNDQEITQNIIGTVNPLTGGEFDDQAARYEAEAQAEQERYDAQLERLRQAKEAQVTLSQGYNEIEQQIAEDHAARMGQIEQAKSTVTLKAAEAGFGSVADLMKSAFGEQSALYKAAFIAQKAAAIAQATIAIQQGIALAAANPWPINLGAMASVAAATAGLVSNIASVAAPGRQYGGGVDAGSMYRVNETGAPEIFNAANGRQYMMPNTRGEVVSNKDATAGNGPASGVAPVVNVNNYTGQAAQAEARFSEADRRWVIDVVVGDAATGGPIGRTVNQITGTKRAGS